MTDRLRDIDETAIVSPEARIGLNVEIGPYSVIGPKVTIGDGTKIGPHVVITGNTTIGKSCRIFAGACLGGEPQDVSYKGEDTYLVIGDNNVIREYVTMSCGTKGGHGVTRVGNNNMFMAYSHVGHDAQIGNNVIITNAVNIAGHVEIGDMAVIGGMVGIHQFVKIGKMVMVGACSKIVKDIVPFMLVDGNPAKVSGVNIVGMKRNGIDPTVRAQIRRLYKILFCSGLNVSQATEKILQEFEMTPEISEVLDFLKKSSRGINR